ncbi:hypothetical protein PANT_3d00090 [Moesziomyces antarcticus T-34]|uniref:DUF924-domain-containing protein n=1 Tax=Pseudozyma antarctica (strain T-34) TaxID=1151754 RepID=M9LT00_PSEA3|nr:hypothetical protein PANT_3d00090 [Moesziomyces antarcticus T-34]
MASVAAALAGRTFEELIRTEAPTLAAGVGALVDMAMFWKAAGQQRHFASSDEFDRQMTDRYSAIYPAVHSERLQPASTPEPTLAEQHLGMILLLDQYPRNAFRGSPKQFQSDPIARKWADIAIQHGSDTKVDPALRLFFYLPYSHSENIDDHNKAVQLGEQVGEPFLGFAKEHKDVIARFGRYCHRNKVLGRQTTDEERHFLENDAPAWAKA